MARVFIDFKQDIIDPQRALKILENCPYDNQRRLNHAHIAEIVDLMRKGTFETTTLSFCSLQKSPHNFLLLDGQHRLWAVVESGKPYTFRCQFDSVSDMEEMGRLYASLDAGLIRNMRQRLQALDGGEHTPDHLAQVGGCVLFIEHGFETSAIKKKPDWKNPQVRLAKFRQWEEEYDLLSECMMGASSKVRKQFMRAGSLSVFLVAARFCPVQTRMLANEIGDNANLEKFSAAWHYHNFFLDRELPDWPQYARYVAAMWGAHYRGKTVQKLYSREAGQPMLIAGTPYDGKIERPCLAKNGHR